MYIYIYMYTYMPLKYITQLTAEFMRKLTDQTCLHK